MDYFLLIIGLIVLVAGAEALVRGASKLAAAFGISPLVIGLTVVAFGTSAPEMAVTTVSGMTGQPGIALGNVLGSNIFNVLFVLGLSALVTPLLVSRRLIRLDVPLMVAASLLVFLFAMDGTVSRLEGVVLFIGIILYTGFLIHQSRRETKQARDEFELQYGKREPFSAKVLIKDLLLILAGLAFLVLGSKWLVDGAVLIARRFGVSDLIVGLTIVAAGTSLPELATSVIASIRGERDIAVGNVVGSCLFNLLAVMGLGGMTAPGGIPVSFQVLQFDLPVMIAVTIACLPVFFTGNSISRWEGGLFLGYYVVYTIYLVMTASGNLAAPVFGAAMGWFVIPLTVITLAVVTARELRTRFVGRAVPE